MERQNAWEKYPEGKKREEVYRFAEDYRRFISDCKTERECVTTLVAAAEQAGFLNLADAIEKGTKLATYVSRCIENEILMYFRNIKKTSQEISFSEPIDVDNEGNPVANAIVQICKDSCIPSKTNEEGIATFNVEVTAEHKLSFTSLPAGYTYEGEAEVYLSDGIDEYTLTVTKSN